MTSTYKDISQFTMCDFSAVWARDTLDKWCKSAIIEYFHNIQILMNADRILKTERELIRDINEIIVTAVNYELLKKKPRPQHQMLYKKYIFDHYY